MKNKRYFIIIVLLLVSFGLSSLAHSEIVDRIVAIVNEDIVTQFDIQKDAAPYVQKINSSKYSKEKKDRLVNKIYDEVLNKLIEQALTSQEAKRYGITISDAQIDGIIENIKSQRSMTQESFERALSLEGTTIEEFREKLRKEQLQSQIINYAVKSKTVITPSDIKQYYDTNAQKYAGKKKHYLRNILMQDMEKIIVVKQQLDENKSFIELAKQFSTAYNASDGGDLGLFDISDFSEPMKSSLLKLGKDEYTDVIKTAQGLQIFYVQDIVVDGKKDYDQAAKEIEEILYREQVKKQFQTWLESLKKNAHIKKML